jgi:predicted short-subunit dehydrogenase-like oxidoreductase (DUF2520 family)
MDSATALTRLVGGTATDSIDALPLQADAFIIAVKDSVLTDVIEQLAPQRSGQPLFHTAGSVPMSVFGEHECHGVIYPMQTFSKERDVDFSCIPFFIEGSNEQACSIARQLAGSVSRNVTLLSSEQRRYLHLAAVFACNFANHCYSLAAELLERHGLPFSAMLPLIDETAQKVHDMSPIQAQTGPAVRYDENVMQAQLELLGDETMMQDVYRLMSSSIHNTHIHNND